MITQNILRLWLLLAIAVLVFASCEKQLEKSPLDKFDNETFWSNETNAMLALTGVYRGTIFANAQEYSPNDWWTYHGLIWTEMGTDNAYPRTGDNATYNKLTNGTMTSSLVILEQYWKNSYERIARCNSFLENIDKVPMNEEKKNRMIAEVRFIRACQYFYMTQFWKSVPLVTKVLTPEDANVVTKASHDDLVTFVITELNEASADLPRHKDIPASEIGRASKQAALAFLGRIQLGEHLYADAVQTYKTIIDFNDNIIDPDYSSIFLESNENSSENIFSIQFIPGMLANSMMKHFAPRIMAGYSVLNPLANLMEAYQFTDGTSFSYDDPRYNYNNIGENRDPRLRYTILYDNAPFGDDTYISHPDSKSVDRLGIAASSQTGYSMKKLVDESFTGNIIKEYGGNIPIIRYAEILLSYLEAKLEAGQAIDQTLLDATVNKVRGRASVNMPAITVTNPGLLRPILRNERRVELALEGIRYWDILRWGIGNEVLNGDFYGEPFPGAKKKPKVKEGGTEDPYKRWYITTRNFREGVDNVWPVPQSEVNINPNLAD